MLEKAFYQLTRSQTCLAFIYTDVIINNVRTSPNVSKWFHNELDNEGNCGGHIDLCRIIFTSMFTLVISSEDTRADTAVQNYGEREPALKNFIIQSN